MIFLYSFLIFSFTSLVSMDSPQNAQRRDQAARCAAAASSRLETASAAFAANAQRLREQKETEEGKDLLDHTVDFFNDGLNAFKSRKSAAPMAQPKKDADEIDRDIQELNRLLGELRSDPTNIGKRSELMSFQVDLVSKQSRLDLGSAAFKKLNTALCAADEQRDAILGKQKPVASAAYRRPDVPQVVSGPQIPHYSQHQINEAQSHLRGIHIKKVNQYNTYAQINAVAALGFVGVAALKGSKEAAGAAVLCAGAGLWCAGKKYQLSRSLDVSDVDAIKFLTQQK